MATGHRPFDGPSAASVIGAILRDQPPPISSRQPLAPRLLDHVVARCLAKDPDERWQNIGDVGRELRWIAESRAEAPGRRTRKQRPVRRGLLRWPGVAIALAMLAASAAALGWFATGAPADPPFARLGQRRARSGPRRRGRVPPATGPSFILSPDGTRIVFVSTDRSGIQSLSTRRARSTGGDAVAGHRRRVCAILLARRAVGRLLRGRQAQETPSRWRGTGHALRRAGRPGRELERRREDHGGARYARRIVAGADRWRNGHAGDELGGRRTGASLATLPARRHGGPVHGHQDAGNYTSADIGVMDFERNVQKVVLPNAGMAPRYLPTGHLAYVSKGTLYVVPFDLERREVHGAAIPVLEGIAADPVFGVGADRRVTRRHDGLPERHDERTPGPRMAGRHGTNRIDGPGAGVLPDPPRVA